MVSSCLHYTLLRLLYLLLGYMMILESRLFLICYRICWILDPLLLLRRRLRALTLILTIDRTVTIVFSLVIRTLYRTLYLMLICIACPSEPHPLLGTHLRAATLLPTITTMQEFLTASLYSQLRSTGYPLPHVALGILRLWVTSIGPVAPNIPQTPGFPRPLFRPSLLRRKLITRGQLGQLPTRQGLNTILLGLFPLPTGFHWTLSHAAPGLPLPPFRLSLLRRKLTMLGRLVTRALPITLLIHRVLTWRGSPNPTALTTPVQPLGPTPTHNFHTAPHKVNHTPPNSLHVAPIRTSPKWLKL